MSQSNQNQNEGSEFQNDSLQKEESSLTIDYLLRQNQVKQRALSKATDLIELLKIQIQVQRNSKHQALTDLQIKLRSEYRKEIDQLKNKNQMLQRQIKRRDQLQNKLIAKEVQFQPRNSARKTLNHNQRPSNISTENGKAKMRRTTSSSELRKSIQNKSSLLNMSQTQISKSSAFQYSIHNRNCSKESRFSKSYKKKAIRQNLQRESSFPLQTFSIEKQLMKQLLTEMQQRQRDLLDGLGFIAQEETQQFNNIACKYQAIAEQAKQSLKNKTKKTIIQQRLQLFQSYYQKSTQIINQQQKMMNRYRSYVSQLQGIISQATVKIKQIFLQHSSSFLKQFFLSESEKTVSLSGLHDASKQINYFDITKGCLGITKNWKAKYNGLKSQNAQLKHILDSMVMLVRQEKARNK